MLISVRAWWWARVRSNAEEMPREVREYIIRRHLKVVVNEAKTLEEKRELSTSLMSSALTLAEDQISPQLRDELIAASSRLLDGVQLGKCATCEAALFVHEGITVENATYCKACASALSR